MKSKKTMFLLGVAATIGLATAAAGVFVATGGKISQGYGNANFVVFDTAKYVTSRRNMTVKLIGDNEEVKNEAIIILAKVERSSRAVIEKIANGRPVIVKQALVVPNAEVEDITDQVLMELGLPTEIPEITPQLPERIMSKFSTTDEYRRADRAYKQVQEINRLEKEAEEEENRMRAEFEHQQMLDKYLP